VTARPVVLVADDDPDILNLVTLRLERDGYEVIAAHDGVEAMERALERAPDLALIDVSMPKLDGYQVTETLRGHDTTRAIPIILLTARAQDADVSRGIEAGADDYVKKPFEVPELVARVRAAIRRAGREAGEPDQLRLGPVAIDLAGRTVARDGREIALTRTEFDLLAELARNPGRVLTRDVLLDRIWGYDYLGDSRLVDVAIQRLRAKIETDPAAPELIQTVRGAGYKAAR
jgi:two-component system response regulator MtrA